jgi:hypothetical protein
MGAHILLFKDDATREDFQYLLQHASLIGVTCFLKETFYADFRRKFNVTHLMFAPRVPWNEIPDEWLDFEGTIVMNNMSYDACREIQEVLGSPVPEIVDERFDEKRTFGGEGGLLRVPVEESGKESEVDWLFPERLRVLLSGANREHDAATWVIPTFDAIATRGFYCAILL